MSTPPTPPTPRSGTRFVTQDKDGNETEADLTALTGIGGKQRGSTRVLMDQDLNLLSGLNGQVLTLSAPGLNLQSAVSLGPGKYRVIAIVVPVQ